MLTRSKKEECVSCNGAPVNHTYEYVNTSISLFLDDLLRSGRAPRPMPRLLERFAVGILLCLHFILEKARIIRYSADVESAPGSRTRSVLCEAKKRGIPVAYMKILGLPVQASRAYLTPRGYRRAKWFYFDSLPIPPWSASTGAAWIDDKRAFNKRFSDAQLPVARSIGVTSQKKTLAAFRDIGGPVIVKPRSGSRARHTTVNIRTEEDLLLAYRKAKQLCRYVLVEEYITGSLYRATCIGKKLIGVVRFVKPSIVADGIMTVRELLAFHNAHKKYPNLTDVKDDQWFHEAISHQGYSPESVPEAGTTILLSEHSERPNGGYFVDATDLVPAAAVAEIERAASVADVDVIGFDLISEDIATRPFTFIEGNTLPFIELHLESYEGELRDTPKALWDLWF